MSDTTTVPHDGAADAAEHAVADTETIAPVETEGAAETETEVKPEPKPSRGERRFAVMSAQLARQGAELAELRGRVAPAQEAPPVAPEVQRLAEAHAERLYQQRIGQERIAAFHTAGKAAYPDWTERCTSLMQMGADSAFADLLVDIPDGAKVAAALADDPDELERIAGLRTERARAIALGKYSAALDAKPAEPEPRPVSRAPAPVVPVRGAARVTFNEYTATPAQLLAHYAKQAQDRR